MEYLGNIVSALAVLIEIVGAVVVVVSIGRALITYLRSFIATRGLPSYIDIIRLDLGRGLVLGLEFLIGADILKSIFAPTWQAIAFLAAIIAIRTVLSLSIDYELAHVRASEHRDGPSEPSERS